MALLVCGFVLCLCFLGVFFCVCFRVLLFKGHTCTYTRVPRIRAKQLACFFRFPDLSIDISPRDAFGDRKK